MKLSDYLGEERGRCAELARLVSEAPAYVSQLSSGRRPVHPALVAKIVSATGQSVRHWDLRPNDWHLIWPELIGSEGAPVPTEQAASAG